VAAFESQVAQEIAIDGVRASLPADWHLETRTKEGDLELRATWGRTIVIEVVPGWLDRETGAGRPRESGPLLRPTQVGARVWLVVDFTGPRLVYVPDARLREFASGTTLTRYPSIDHIIRLAPQLGFSRLDEVIAYVTQDAKANEA
jgi:hypothetical protein